MTFEPNTTSLVADVGGTNTRVALAKDGQVLTDTIDRFRNADYPGLETVLQSYLKGRGNVDPKAACVAIAGPVRDGRASMTNLDWDIEDAALSQAINAETVIILNDLQAQGHALGHIAPEAIETVIPFPQAPADAARLVIGVGTGFNSAAVFEIAGTRLVTASEAGHQNMHIGTAEDLSLCAYLTTPHGPPSVEDILSGRGLERVYAWLAQTEGEVAQLQAAAIMQACADGSDPRALQAARVFSRFLGNVAGNLALTLLPFGGVYLAGGVSRAMGPYLERFGFAEAFRDKGRFAGFMGNFGVGIIDDDYAALTGCAAHLQQTR